MKKITTLLISTLFVFLSNITCYAAELTPATGDEGVPNWVFILMGISLVAIIVMSVLSFKKDEKEENDSNDNNRTND